MILPVAVSFPWAYLPSVELSLVWYGITFFRNVVVIGFCEGLDPRDWSARDINFENATHPFFDRVLRPPVDLCEIAGETPFFIIKINE